SAYVVASWSGGSKTSSPDYPGTSGTNTTASGTITGLPSGKNITLTGYFIKPTGTTSSADPTTFTTASPPQPPSGTPSVSASPSGSEVVVSWSSVSGATGYRIYANDNAGSGDYYKAATSSTSHNITL